MHMFLTLRARGKRSIATLRPVRAGIRQLISNKLIVLLCNNPITIFTGRKIIKVTSFREQTLAQTLLAASWCI